MKPLTQQEQLRYSRHILLEEVGKFGQEKLKHSRVLIIGAGGLGCPVLQYLCAAGIGTIGIVDSDFVDESNLQRQVLFGTSTIGQNKAEAAKRRLKDLNPLISINAYPIKLTQKNAIDLFKKYDLVVDGTDNFATRYLINDASIITKRPVVYGSIYRYEGQVSVFNYENGPSYRCLFPTPPTNNSIPNCSQIGVLGVLPGIIGAYQANEVLKIIIGIGKPLSGKLLIVNALTNQISMIAVKRSEKQIEQILSQRNQFKRQEYINSCNTDFLEGVTQISAEQLLTRIQKGDNFQFIDVRQPFEQPKFDDLTVLNIPIQFILERHNEIDKKKKSIILCQSGIRSMKAIKTLQTKGYKNLINLKGGVLAWVEENLKIPVTP